MFGIEHVDIQNRDMGKVFTLKKIIHSCSGCKRSFIKFSPQLCPISKISWFLPGKEWLHMQRNNKSLFLLICNYESDLCAILATHSQYSSVMVS